MVAGKPWPFAVTEKMSQGQQLRREREAAENAAASEQHSAGGKNAFPLPPGMHGTVVFNGDRQQFRTVLTRHWGETRGLFVLWIGLNPSTASADINDMTITKEIGFTKAECFTDYVKVNLSDYRATDPMNLRGLRSYEVRSPGNLDAIRALAADAALVIVAWGDMHNSISYLRRETLAALTKDGRKLWCLGKTAFGSPRHPSRLPYATPLERYW